MDYEASYAKALALAAKAHEGQFDRAGKAYIHHPITVSSYCITPAGKICGLLHDLLEDTCVTEEELRGEFGDEVTDAVVLLTKRPGEDYMTYVARLGDNAIAREVKLADLRHNMDLTRGEHIGERDVQRLVSQYVPAFNYLKERCKK